MSTETFLSDVATERFIHNTLKVEVRQILDKIMPVWRPKGERLPTVLVAWPREHIKDDAGQVINGRVLLETDERDPAKLAAIIAKFVARTKAFGVLVVQDFESGLESLLETPLGASWWLIDDHSGTRRITHEDDRKTLGILYHRGALN